jgi:Phage portal protein
VGRAVNLLRRALSRRHDDYLHSYAGNQYWGVPLPSWRSNEEGISANFADLVANAYKGNAVVFACELTRVALFSELRFKWQDWNTGEIFGKDSGESSLRILEQPWPGGSTADLLAHMLTDADFGGTSFIARQVEDRGRLKRMRPDWCTIVLGSNDDPQSAGMAMDADFLGIMYHPGGQGSGKPAVPLLADEVTYFAPNPDPLAAYRGVSWLEPVLNEIKADRAATLHKLMFFENGATPQMVVTMGPEVNPENLHEYVAKMDKAGLANAYKTLYIAAGSTVNVVGKDLAQLEFSKSQGAGETRIAAASGVHPVVVALSEGMAGSSLNEGNFGAAKRLVADRTLRPLWARVCSSLERIVPPPAGARLWYSERDIAFLQEDRQDAAKILFTKVQALRQLVDAGFDPVTAVPAVTTEDLSGLKHTGLPSVQVQPGPTSQPELEPSGNGDGRPAIAAGRRN